jgi:hypothetical protein
VVGRITFAVIGAVDLYLKGNFRGEIAGTAIRFDNPKFEDDDMAGHVIGDMENPQIGEVNLISFDPHPNLAPHPYIEWFSIQNNHYRIELQPQDARILSDSEAAGLDRDSRALRDALSSQVRSTRDRSDSDWV